MSLNVIKEDKTEEFMQDDRILHKITENITGIGGFLKRTI